MRTGTLTLGVLVILWSLQAAAAEPVGQAPGKQATGFAGGWVTTYGPMTLDIEGEQVTGTYDYGSGSGTISGHVRGSVLTFTYTESSGATGEGEFILADDGRSFSGRWRESGDNSWQEWTGSRAGSASSTQRGGAEWLIVLESIWDESMGQEGYSFGEMLEAYFERCPWVGFRHRFIVDGDDLAHFCAAMHELEGRKIILIACHGSTEGLAADRRRISNADVAAALALVPDLELVHFSSCNIMAGDAAGQILDAYPAGATMTVSGYKVSVDWPHSAVFEFLYLDYILSGGMTPEAAAELVAREMSFSADDDSADYNLHFRAITRHTGRQ